VIRLDAGDIVGSLDGMGVVAELIARLIQTTGSKYDIHDPLILHEFLRGDSPCVFGFLAHFVFYTCKSRFKVEITDNIEVRRSKVTNLTFSPAENNEVTMFQKGAGGVTLLSRRDSMFYH
jgi:hypothetical protein